MPPTWPSAMHYSEAVQNPHLAFSDVTLQSAQVVTNRLGLPDPRSGQFAVVYQLETPTQRYAVKCFTTYVHDQQYRYASIAMAVGHRPLPAFIDFAYVPHGVLIDGMWYPIVKMTWVPGDLLEAYLPQAMRTIGAIRRLDEAFVGLIRALQTAGVAHGDLQNGNIKIDGGQIRLLDYDGMFVPALAGRPPGEVGQPDFQHPQRSTQDWGPRIDDFSALLIHLTLLAIDAQPTLWQEFHRDPNQLLFTRNDFLAPGQSPIWGRLRSLGNDEVTRLTGLLEAACRIPANAAPSFSAITDPGSVLRGEEVLQRHGLPPVVPGAWQAPPSGGPPPPVYGGSQPAPPVFQPAFNASPPPFGSQPAQSVFQPTFSPAAAPPPPVFLPPTPAPPAAAVPPPSSGMRLSRRALLLGGGGIAAAVWAAYEFGDGHGLSDVVSLLSEPTETPKLQKTSTPVPTDTTPATRTRTPTKTSTPSRTRTPSSLGIEVEPLSSYGALYHNSGDAFESVMLSEDLGDFEVTATFLNPFDGEWDYGFVFRDRGKLSHIRALIRSNGSWYVFRMNDRSLEVNPNGFVAGNYGTSESNDLRLRVIGTWASLYVNSDLAGQVLLPTIPARGRLSLATCLLTGDERPGYATEYSNVKITSYD